MIVFWLLFNSEHAKNQGGNSEFVMCRSMIGTLTPVQHTKWAQEKSPCQSTTLQHILTESSFNNSEPYISHTAAKTAIPHWALTACSADFPLKARLRTLDEVSLTSLQVRPVWTPQFTPTNRRRGYKRRVCMIQKRNVELSNDSKPAETAWQGKRSPLTAAIDQQVNLR